MEEAVTVRKICPHEGLSLRAIRIRAISDSPDAFGSTLAETEARPAEYWEGRARDNAAGVNSVMFVAEESGIWTGIAGCYREEGATGLEFDLISMWVDPACRGRGIGRLLVDAVASWAGGHGASELSLWVTETNQPAVALYQSAGFRFTEERQPLPSNPGLLERRMVLPL
jgi:ribosomal protein S18 acetylase RimI-like enzyme